MVVMMMTSGGLPWLRRLAASLLNQVSPPEVTTIITITITTLLPCRVSSAW